MKKGNIAMKKNFFKKHLLTCAAVLMLLALSTNLYAGTPAAPTWTVKGTSGATYNTQPYLFWTASSSGSSWTINDVEINIDDDSNFGSVNYSITASNDATSKLQFYPLGTNWTSAASIIRHRVNTVLIAKTWYARVKVKDSDPASRNWSNGAIWTFAIASASWTDSTITEGTTLIKAAHFNELKTAIDNVRLIRGQAAGTYTNWTYDSTKLIKAQDITDLRTALKTAMNWTYATGAPVTGSAPTYSDDPPTAGATLIRKTHIDELRDKVILP